MAQAEWIAAMLMMHELRLQKACLLKNDHYEFGASCSGSSWSDALTALNALHVAYAYICCRIQYT